jgi:hypothetical protein
VVARPAERNRRQARSRPSGIFSNSEAIIRPGVGRPDSRGWTSPPTGVSHRGLSEFSCSPRASTAKQRPRRWYSDEQPPRRGSNAVPAVRAIVVSQRTTRGHSPFACRSTREHSHLKALRRSATGAVPPTGKRRMSLFVQRNLVAFGRAGCGTSVIRQFVRPDQARGLRSSFA